MTPSRSDRQPDDEEKFGSFGNDTIRVAIAAVAFIVVIAGYLISDRVGLLPRVSEVSLTGGQNWPVGQTRRCRTVPLGEEIAARSGRRTGYALANADCGAGPEQRMPVTFFGREDQPEYSVVIWDCTRRSDDVVCREKSGVRAAEPK